jgi:hypothetical protein
MKTCPYCSNRLPFFNLIWQRLKANRDSAIVCKHCTSLISQNGGASWIDGTFSCIAGALSFYLIDFDTVYSAAVAFLVAFLVLSVSSYFTAPIRKS